MVKLGRVSKHAGKLLKSIVDKMPLDELRDYKIHMAGPGYTLRTITEIEAARELYEVGFLTRQTDIMDPAPVYLTRSGWERFQRAEWSEIQRAIDIREAGPDFGSW